MPAEASRPSGSSLDQIAAIIMVTRARATGVVVPDASQLLPAGRVHPVCIRNIKLAGSPAVANRPAEAARCLESCEHPDTRVPSEYAGFSENDLRVAHIASP